MEMRHLVTWLLIIWAAREASQTSCAAGRDLIGVSDWLHGLSQPIKVQGS